LHCNTDPVACGKELAEELKARNFADRMVRIMDAWAGIDDEEKLEEGEIRG
jgi:hypothetical protein